MASSSPLPLSLSSSSPLLLLLDSFVACRRGGGGESRDEGRERGRTELRRRVRAWRKHVISTTLGMPSAESAAEKWISGGKVEGRMSISRSLGGVE